MTPRALLRLLAIWSAVLLVCSVVIFRAVRIDRTQSPAGPYVVSVWQRGQRTARTVVSSEPEHVLEG
ncbi:MAG TPA: hypothetical protein VER96_32890, partial [Polyangiaceae bacterium]|nr:hypothetical protein [Polyangiaceae bacterium]